MTVAGLCVSRSHRDGTLYRVLRGDKGEVEQWGLATDAACAMRGRIARRWSLGSEAGYCAADDRGSVYIAQEAVGAWRFAAEPEAEIVPEIVDIVRLGHIEEEAKRSEEHTSELQSLMRNSYAVFCLKKKKHK